MVSRARLWSASLLVLILAGGGSLSLGEARYHTQDPATKLWPPQFPREGATKVFENERVVVWDQVWPTTNTFHRHVRDTLSVALEDGSVTITQLDGRTTVNEHLNNTKIPGFSHYIKAGAPPHAERATDPNHRPHGIFIEFKGTEPKDCKEWSQACQ